MPATAPGSPPTPAPPRPPAPPPPPPPPPPDTPMAAGQARSRQDACTLGGCAEGSAKCGANAPALHARRHGDEQ
ncbi:hypothetical protein ACUNGZ_26230 [Serratia sp. IR-2025]